MIHRNSLVWLGTTDPYAPFDACTVGCLQICFQFWSFLINIREMNPDKSFFFKSNPFELRQSIRRDL
jgi:hypothetical protein